MHIFAYVYVYVYIYIYMHIGYVCMCNKFDTPFFTHLKSSAQPTEGAPAQPESGPAPVPAMRS